MTANLPAQHVTISSCPDVGYHLHIKDVASILLDIHCKMAGNKTAASRAQAGRK